MKQAVIRKTLTGDWTAFTFDRKAQFFFVKNFTEDVIYVSFESGTNTNACIKINSGMGEECFISLGGSMGEYFTDTIYVKGTGEVEVQGEDIYA